MMQGKGNPALWMRKTVWGAALALLACLAVCTLPSEAKASFKDYDTSHPAAQDLGTYGDPMSGADIPDGTYVIPARTDSRMCVFYKSAEDVGTTTKELAVLTVSNGNMYASFYSSKMYNYLYLGTAEEAASLTSEDGTDPSAYIPGDPSMGYVPHFFTLSVPALNVPMTFSSFAGGNYEIENERAKWYSHEVVFASTDEIAQAIEASMNPNPEPENQDGQETGGGEGDGSAGSGDAGDEGAGQEGGQGTEREEGGAGLEGIVIPEFGSTDFDGGGSGGASGASTGGSGSNGQSAGQGGGSAANSAGVTGQSAQSSADTAPSGTNPTSANAGDSAGSAAETASGTKRGVVLKIASAAPEADVAINAPAFKQKQEKAVLSLPQILAIAGGVLVAAGAVGKVLMYRHEFEAPKEADGARPGGTAAE